jgi:hypothetical protein
MRVLSTFIAGLVAVLPLLARGTGANVADEGVVREVVRRYVTPARVAMPRPSRRCSRPTPIS